MLTCRNSAVYLLMEYYTEMMSLITETSSSVIHVIEVITETSNSVIHVAEVITLTDSL